MKVLEKHQRTSVQDYGAYLERFELQEDEGRFKLVLSAGYQHPLEENFYELSCRPEATLEVLFPEQEEDCFVDPVRKQSLELERVLGVGVKALS